MKIEVKETGFIRKSWKWRAIARNGKIMASGRGFDEVDHAVKSIKTLKDELPGAPIEIRN